MVRSLSIMDIDERSERVDGASQIAIKYILFIK
jgi:hypothetical protein